MLPVIVHLESDSNIRHRLKEALKACIDVRSHTVPEEALREKNVELFVCGPLDKHSEGLIFALEQQRAGKKVLILADRRKFSRLPFLSTGELSDKPKVRARIMHHINLKK